MTAIIAVAAIAAVGLAVFLSYRLRAGEIATAVKLGARRFFKGRCLFLSARERLLNKHGSCAAIIAGDLSAIHSEAQGIEMCIEQA